MCLKHVLSDAKCYINTMQDDKVNTNVKLQALVGIPAQLIMIYDEDLGQEA